MSIVLRIPEHRLEGFIKLSKMSNDAFKEFFHEIAKADSKTNSEELIRSLVASLKLTSEKDASGITKTVQSLFAPIITNGKPIGDFVEDILVALDNQDKAKLSNEDKETLRVRLNALLTIPGLSIKAKAMSVYYENERTYTSARLLSEVRPIFGLEDDSIGGVVVLHTLKIQYLEQESDKEIFFALDDADLDQLIKTLEREKNKTNKIRKLFSEKSIQILEIENQ